MNKKFLPVVLCGIFFVAISINILLIAFDWNATTYSSVSWSPGRSLGARVVVWRGTALDIDYARVFVTKAHHPFGTMVYEGPWFGDEHESTTPYLKWTNSSLAVECPGEYYDASQCKHIAGTVIECEPMKEIK